MPAEACSIRILLSEALRDVVEHQIGRLEIVEVDAQVHLLVNHLGAGGADRQCTSCPVASSTSISRSEYTAPLAPVIATTDVLWGFMPVDANATD